MAKDCISTFMKALKSLKKLQFHHIVPLNNRNALTEELFLNLGLHCPLLESFSIVHGIVESPTLFMAAQKIYIQENIMQDFVQRCSFLNTLDISSFTVSEIFIRHIVQNCVSLNDISFTSCDVPERAMLELGNMTKLKKLNIAKTATATNKGVINLVKNNHELEYLNFENCYKLTDACLKEVAKNCPKLTKIELSMNGDVEEEDEDDEDIYGFTREGIELLAKGCPLLQNIDLLYNQVYTSDDEDEDDDSDENDSDDDDDDYYVPDFFGGHGCLCGRWNCGGDRSYGFGYGMDDSDEEEEDEDEEDEY